jgi:glutaredoxin 3
MCIKLYVISECPYCNMARELLEEKGVDYEEYDILEEDSVARELIQKTGQVIVPVLDIDGVIIGGFDSKEID